MRLGARCLWGGRVTIHRYLVSVFDIKLVSMPTQIWSNHDISWSNYSETYFSPTLSMVTPFNEARSLSSPPKGWFDRVRVAALTVLGRLSKIYDYP